MTLVYRPRNRGNINNRVGESQYSFTVVRPPRVLNEFFIIRFRSNANDGTCTNGLSNLNFNEEIYDSGNNAQLAAIPSPTITVDAGQYMCHVMAQVFNATNGYRIAVTNSGTTEIIGTGFTTNNGGATVYGSFIIDSPTANAIVRVQSDCPGGAPALNGVNEAGGGSFNVYRSLTCTRLQ